MQKTDLENELWLSKLQVYPRSTGQGQAWCIFRFPGLGTAVHRRVSMGTEHAEQGGYHLGQEQLRWPLAGATS